MITPTKVEATVEHHHHNGNLGEIIPYIDSNEKGIELDASRNIISVDHDKLRIPGIGKTHEMEVVPVTDELRNTEERKEKVDDYEHSLWQWPTGRSCFVKVSNHAKLSSTTFGWNGFTPISACSNQNHGSFHGENYSITGLTKIEQPPVFLDRLPSF